MNNKDVNSRDTNESSRTHHDPKKRAATVEQSDESQAVPVDHVTVRQLELQVDDLVDNYNKLAKSLNRPQIDEANASGIKFSPSKLVSVIACNDNYFCTACLTYIFTF